MAAATDPDEKSSAVQLAELRGQIDNERAYAGPLLRPLWSPLARLTAIVAALWRRLPPE